LNFHVVQKRCASCGKAADAVFERIIESFYGAHLSPGDVAVDIGAHAGRHLLPLSEVVGPRGRVIGFEPLPRLCLALLEKVAPLGNVVVFPYALGRSNQVSSFTEIENAPAYSGIRQREIFNQDVLRNLKVNRFPSLVARADTALSAFVGVRFIKIDVEGGELDVLVGAEGILLRDRPAIAFEHGWSAAQTYGYSRDDFFGFFARCGYRLLDCLAEPFDATTADAPWYLFAFPQEDFVEKSALLNDCVRDTIAGELPD
jgi:FkbM family methyltransferase